MHYFGALVLTLLGLVNELRSIELNNNNATNHWPRAKLDVFPQFVNGLGPGQKLILGKNNESLNITCKAVYQNPNGIEPSLDYVVDWKVPSHVKDKIQSNKIMVGQGKNIAWLWFDRLSERDAGDYTCKAVPSKSVGQTLSITINLSVKSKPTFCGHQWFRCRSSHCIMERYLCDGKPDCEEGEDETASAGCTSNPCLGKVLCDGRCIPPEWCCDHRNCSGTYGLRPWPPETPEISYVQTAFYTVIGCAMAFMLIVTILVIAICRVQIKRAMNSRWTQQNRNNCPRRRNVPMPIYDLDVYLNRTVDNYSRGVSIMYNINSGVQFVGRPVEPPPYSEVIASPPREGPPPPYVSCENLIEQTSAPSRQSENPTVDQTDSTTLETSSSLPIQSSDLRDDSSGFSGVVITSRSIPGPQVPTVSHISSTNTGITDNTSNRAGHSLPQTFDLEYVETDALLSENANIKISSPKETIRKPYLRCGLLRDRGKDQNFSKFWYYGGTDKNKDNSPLRSKDLSSADSENEGVFLDTDQQEIRSDTCREPIPSTSTNNTEQSITDKNKIMIDKNNKRSNESSNDNQSSQIDKIIVPSNLDGNQLDTLSANSSQTRTTLNDTRANKTNESSTTMSTILVPPSDHQTEANNVDITANEPLVLPLRESFIGVQRNS